ncbi:MAG: DUF4037 domain-containing protein [Spirochaetes bacterium]|nr:DUF4037 domain-containing protein [Spirochaetota bacterium]
MNALALSQNYFENTAFPAIKNAFPELSQRIAAGLAGNGSECFGYDDELSRDHDWGIDFFIWLREEDRGMIRELADFKKSVFMSSPPRFKRVRSDYGALVNVMTAGDFYRQLIGFPEGPDEIKQWRIIPEENLAMAVNGRVFFDGAGEFTKTRDKLLKYYPEDLRLKKMAARCMAIAQTGQYNFMRMSKRQDWVTVQTVLTRFNDNVTSLVFLLNKVFRPFYKWAHRRMKELPVTGKQTGMLLQDLVFVEGFTNDALMKRNEIINSICGTLTEELVRQELTDTDDWFFTSHGEQIQRKIQDDFLKSLLPQYE